MDKPQDAAHPTLAATLDHLTGASRGTATWLGAPALDISLSPERFIQISQAQPGETRDDLVARLQRVGNSYQIEAPEDRPVWVNGRSVTTRLLQHGDMIEFGEAGPLSRFRLHGGGGTSRKMFSEILSDSVAYLRTSRRPMLSRVPRAVGGLARRMTRETTILFRVSVIVALIGLTALAYQQYRLNVRLQQSIESGSTRIDSLASALVQTRNEALQPGDLAALHEEMKQRLSASAERVEALEQRSGAGARVIAEARSAVMFLQGAYGFREITSGRMLRLVTGEGDEPLVTPAGQPLLSLESDGPIAEVQFTGTGFLVGDNGALVTNRHVAQPWRSEAGTGAMALQGLEPVMVRFIAYLPGRAQPVDVEMLAVSESADLAVLIGRDWPEDVAGLRIADTRPATGDEVILLGYPTGLRSMLAQSGTAFIDELQLAGITGFWSIAARLANAGYVAPLASRGIVGRATDATVVYDAETTYGGSGGPVLDMAGNVVAVNAAILPEYGGSNLGVPVAKLVALLAEAGLAVDGDR